MSRFLPRLRRHWIEYVATLVALVVSVISAWVAIGTERANRDMVAAASWPLLQVEGSNSDAQDRAHIELSIVNSGVGPAKLKTLEISWNGKSYPGSYELMSACCGFKAHGFPAPAGAPLHTPMTTGKVSGIVIRAGERRRFLSLPLGPDNEKTWKALDAVRYQFVYRACYCSVFDECWIGNLNDLEAKRVDRCPAVATPYIE